MLKTRISNEIRYRLTYLLNIILVIALLLGPVGLASAQDVTPTPEPTEAVTETPDPTEEPTTEPTSEPTVEPTEELTVEPTIEPTDAPTETPEALPNLVFAASEGWDAPLVISSQSETHTNDTLTVGADAFLDLAVLNDSTVDVLTRFTLCLKIDGEQRQCWDATTLTAGEFFLVEDWPLPALAEGAHSFEAVVDVNNNLLETDKIDNTWTGEFTWSMAEVEEEMYLLGGDDYFYEYGSSTPPDGIYGPVVEMFPQSAVMLDGVPAFKWNFGGTPTVGAMIAGYFDRHGFDNMYTGPTDGGVMPLTDTGWGTWADNERAYAKNPLIASQDGLDGWTGRGTNEDYWIQYLNNENDPYITGGWTQHSMSTIGDYMGTSQTAFLNPDGATKFPSIGNSSKVNCSTSTSVQYGDDGLRDFYVNRGYSVTDCYSQRTDNVISGAFSFANYKAEIDAGYPVMIHLYTTNYYHAITGFGYDDSTSPATVYFYDTWDYAVHTLPWGGAYKGIYAMDSVTIVHPGLTAPSLIAPNGPVADDTPEFSWNSVEGATHYRLQLKKTSDQGIALDEIIDTSSCSEGICRFSPEVPLNESFNYRVYVASGIGITFGPFSIPLTFGINDSFARAWPLQSYQPVFMNTSGADIDISDPVNVCNGEDTQNVWFKLSGLGVSGVKSINILGSDYEPNITIVRADRNHVVCGETNGGVSEESKTIAFYYNDYYTYYVGISSTTDGNLTIKITGSDCPNDSFCYAGVEGDGRVMRTGDLQIKNSNKILVGYGKVGPTGLITGKLFSGNPSGSYLFNVFSDYSLCTTYSSSRTGEVSAYGKPLQSIIVKDLSGNEYLPDYVGVTSSSSSGVWGKFKGTTSGTTNQFYLPGGTYNFIAIDDEEKLEIIQPGITVSTSGNPPLVMDASTMVSETFTVAMDGISDGYIKVNSSGDLGIPLSITNNENMTLAAPVNTPISSIDFLSQSLDASERTWKYEFALSTSPLLLTGASTHSYQVGGTLTIAPYVTSTLNSPPPIPLTAGGITVYPNLSDAYNNSIQSIYINDESSTIASAPTYTIFDPGDNSVQINPTDGYLWKPITHLFTTSSLLGTWTANATIDLGPLGSGEKTGSVEFEVVLPVAADLITEATPIVLSTSYRFDPKGGTLSTDSEHPELMDPINVCNSGDEGSVWLQFVAPTTGIFTLNTYGSGYNPNLTILQKEIILPHKPINCGETDQGSTEGYKKLSFYGQQGKVYLIGISSSQGESLSVKIVKEDCTNGDVCGVGIEGDGRVMHSAIVEVFKPDGSDVGHNSGSYSGFFRVRVNRDKTALYQAKITGKYSLVVEQNKMLGYYNPSAVGLPIVSISVKDINGTQISTNKVAIVNKANNYLGVILDGTSEVGERDYYLPSGLYSLMAMNSSVGLEVYDPMVIINPTGGGSVNLDASGLAHHYFSFVRDGDITGSVYFYNPEYWALDMPVPSNRTITFAAPANTLLPYIGYSMYKNESSTERWGCELDLENNSYIVISDGGTQTFTMGGALILSPYVKDAPLRSDEAYGYIYPGVSDSHNNAVTNIYYETEVSSSSVENITTVLVPESFGTFTAQNGSVFYRSISNENELTFQSISYELPSYRVEKDNEYYYFILHPINDRFSNPAGFWLDYFVNPIGTWKIKESINLGAFGGGKSSSFTFDVYETDNFYLDNDDFINPRNIPSLPETITDLNTKSATTNVYDPVIPTLNSKGYGSVWFKYVADRNAVLSIDTFGSDYDTVLTVWQGTITKLTNRAFNDDADDPNIIERTTTSQVSVPIVKGQTYFIEVTEYADGETENPYIQSLEEGSNTKPEIVDQQVGGMLDLKIQETDPCFSFSLSSSTEGSVKTLTNPNCLSNYISGTSITITGTHNLNYGFLNWTNPLAEEFLDNPYTFTINEDTALRGNFVLLTAPLNLSRPVGWLTTDNTPEFSWDAVPYGSTYEIQIDNVATFTLPLEHTSTTAELSYSTPTLADGTHYWRVRILNHRGEPGAWTASRSFIVDTAPPAIPALLTPAAAAWVRGTPTFTWSAPTTATGYIFEYAEDEVFTTNVVTSSTLTTPKTTPAPLALGDHWWHVKVRDAAGNWSEFSAPRKLTIRAPLSVAPLQMLPASGLLTKDNPVTFTWSEPAYAESYEVEFSLNKKFTPVLNRVSVDDSIASHTFANDGLFYWRVRGLNNLDEPGAWSAARAFTLDTTPPPTPSIITPVANSFTITTRPTFTVGGATTAKFYGFEIYREPDGVDLIWEGRSGKPSYIPTIAQELPFGQLYWRAYAEDAAGNRSTYSNPAGTPFNVSILKIPAHASFVYTTKPSFAWTAVSGATGYRIQVGINSDFTEGVVIDEARPVSTTYIPTTALELGTTYYWRMCVNKGVDCSDYTPAYSFMVASTPPAAPILALPKTATITQVTTPNFNWNAALNAVSYEIQIDNAATFTLPLEQNFTDASLTYTANPALAEGLHFWRVRALNAQGAPGAWSRTFSFTIDNTAPNVPTLISPVDDMKVITYIPKFTVNKVLTATRYVFEVCSNNDCSILRWTKQMTVPTYVPIAAESLPIGDSWWRVRSLDALGNSSEWSPIAHFFVTNQKTPVDGFVITTTSSAKPVFSWLAYPGATGYELFVYDDEAHTHLAFPSIEVTTTSYTAPVGLVYGNYNWVLKVKLPSGDVNTGYYTFTVSPTAPAAPLLLSPATGWNTKVSPVPLVWNNVGLDIKYDIQISRIKTFSTLAIPQERTASPNYDFAPALDGLYYWRVRSVNTHGVAGAWSAVRTFIYDTANPAAPVLSAPLNGAAVYTQTPPLSVIKMTDAARYEFDVFSDEALSIREANGTSLTNIFKVPMTLPFGRYWWQARVYDKAGNPSSWSNPRSFDVTILKTPVNNFYTTNPVQPFAWVAVPGATGYEIEVCKEYDESNECVSLQRSFTRPVSTTYTPTAGDAFTDGIYYWRIRAITAGVPGAWTLPNKFTKVH